ncbi:RNA-directed DNA polymerase from mobile element jockey [Trichonephila clavipes]|nr:RNA-directed DNA polymerase from mobile element jockey [Trichonephila clavipes]
MDPSCFGFRLASWNANGIKSRIVEVRDFIDKHHPDVFLIQESHLGPGDTIHIPNYMVYRNDRPRTTSNLSRGGTVILLKSSLPHHHTPTPPMGTVEATSVTLTPPGGDPLVITSLYISPSVSYQHIHTDVEALFSLGGASIICGDFNAHHTSWGCRRNDNRGNIIRNLIDSTDTQIVAPTTPTRFGHNSASIIDFALTRNIHWLSQVESIAELSSHHNPLIISFDTNLSEANRDYRLGDLSRAPKPRPLHFSPNHCAHGGRRRNTSCRPHRRDHKHTRTLFQADSGWEFLLRFGRDPSAHDRTEQSQKRRSKPSKNKTWEDELRALDPDDGSLWEMSKELRKKKSPVYALNGQGGIAHTDSDKAEQQHGFRPQLSTSHQLLRVVEYAKSGFKEKKYTGAVFLDIQKAFDRVWHTGLLYKLIKINTPPQLILIIKSFLNNRSFAVRVNDTHSSTKQIRAGAPQGALLSPTLFNIYINDIPKTRQTTVCLYADDTAILTQSANKNCITHFLHRHLTELEDWYKKWKISINPEKTEAVFSAGHGTHKPPPVYVQNHPVPWSKSVNYLGVTLDQHLSFNEHITKIDNKFRALACLYYPYFTRNSPLTIKNRLLIYTSILRPVLLYASPNFFSTDSTPFSVAASPLDERKVTLRSLKPTASAATPLRRLFGNLGTIKLRTIFFDFFDSTERHA